MPFHFLAVLLLLPILLAARLAFGVLALLFWAIAGLCNKLAFWRRSRLDLDDRASHPFRSSAFEDYRRATLLRLEDEAREFRSFLDRLRQAADAADFEAFLKARRQGSHKDIATN